MKQTQLFLALIVVVLLAACASKTEFTITGHASDFEDGRRAYLVTFIDDEPVILDSAIVENHSFTMKGKVEKPSLAKIGVLESFESVEGIMIEMILEPGHIMLGDYDEANSSERTATGTPLNDKLTQFFCEKKTITDNTSLTRRESMESVFALVRSYVLANADNQVGIYLLERFHFSMPKEMKLELIDAMSETNPTLYEDLQKETLEEMEAQKRAEEMAQCVAPGNPYRNVEGKDLAGSAITLKGIVENKKNRYVLLDFWATWCSPCMYEVPYLKAAYEKYHGRGFEIYALSIDHDRDAWTKVIKEEKLQWVNVLRESTEATEQYGVRGVPSNFLIDCSTGKIVATHLRGDALTAKLAELFE